MIAYPGGDAYIYLDITRNGEPVDSGIQPRVVSLLYNGLNLLDAPITMTVLDTGLYYVPVPISEHANQGGYLVVIEYSYLGKQRREVQNIDVVKDPITTLLPVINSVKDFVQALLPHNTRYEFVRALSNVTERNVAAGRLDRIHFSHKHTNDTDYSTPVAEGERMFVYETIGDVNPVIVEGL